MKVMLANIGKIVNVMGGRQRVFCNMANALAAKGYDVSCLYMDEIDGKPYFRLDSSVKCYNLLHLNMTETYIYPPPVSVI